MATTTKKLEGMLYDGGRQDREKTRQHGYIKECGAEPQ
jgi:hypothetical protein